MAVRACEEELKLLLTYGYLVGMAKDPLFFLLVTVGLIIFTFIFIETARHGNLGFAGQSFWEWMRLLLIPVVLAIASYFLSRFQKKTYITILILMTSLKMMTLISYI